MKKQTNLPAGVRKLSLNKKTISNLTAAEMSKHVGGSTSCNYSNLHTCRGGGCDGGGTQNGNSCPGHNTCYNC